MIEIVEREPCPTCGGTKRITAESQPGEWIACPACRGIGTVPRTLATFADAAALRDKMLEVMFDCGPTYDENIADALLRALGVSDA